MDARTRKGVPLVLIWGAAWAAALAGCQARTITMNQSRGDLGLIVVLPGIDGRAGYNEEACWALADRHIDAAVELRDWTTPLGPLFNQAAYERNRQAAAELARHILEYRRGHPDRPIHLVGHSGGTAIAVWAAEALPDEPCIDGIVLLASSLSPEYDLSPALRRTRKGILSFSSSRDGVLLDLGTTVVGTMDRKHTVSAGKTGFRRPNACQDPAAYGRLYELRWDERAARLGHDGGHFACLGRRFLGAYVQPFLTAAFWDAGLVASVTEGTAALALGGPIASVP